MTTLRMVDSTGSWDVLQENGDVLGRMVAGKYLTFDPILGSFVETPAVVDGLSLYVQPRVMDLHDVEAYEQGLIGRFVLHEDTYALFMGRTGRDRIYRLREVADAQDAATVA